MNIFGSRSRSLRRLTDLDRVCELPEVPELSAEEVKETSEYFILEKARKEGFLLLPEQAHMVLQYVNFGGLFGSAAAGAGKTLTALLVSNLAFRGENTEQCEKILYLLPSALERQLKTAVTWSRGKINFTAPMHYFSDYKKVEDRIKLSETAGPGVYVLGYGLLSGQHTEEMIHNVNPSLIIADECHTLSNKKSARTRRIMNFLKENPYTKLALLSGTICRKNIKEYHHLITFTLKDNSPVPIPWPQLEVLSTALAGDGDFIPTAELSLSKPLADWAKEEWTYGGGGRNIDPLRRAYHKRLKTAPGVFISKDSAVASSLYLNCIKTKGHGSGGYEELKELIKEVNDTWTTPNGDEFDYALQKFKWLNELSQGFYNSLTWPEEHPQLSIAKEKHEIQNEFNKEVRTFLGGRHIRGLDTPLLLRKRMALNGDTDVPELMYQYWKKLKDFEKYENLPTRTSSPVRVCDFKVREICEIWKDLDKNNTGGIIWYYNTAFGYWLKEIMEEYDKDIVFAPAGQKYKDLISKGDLKGKTVIASLTAHGTGTDGLQHSFSKVLFAQNLHTATVAEQALARVHRHGQKEDEVFSHIVTASRYDDLHLSGILHNAYFLHLTHIRQRLLTGDWMSTPKHFTATELQEAGVEVPKELSERMSEELHRLI